MEDIDNGVAMNNILEQIKQDFINYIKTEEKAQMEKLNAEKAKEKLEVSTAKTAKINEKSFGNIKKKNDLNDVTKKSAVGDLSAKKIKITTFNTTQKMDNKINSATTPDTTQASYNANDNVSFKSLRMDNVPVASKPLVLSNDADLRNMQIELRQTYDLFRTVGNKFENISLNSLANKIKGLKTETLIYHEYHKQKSDLNLNKQPANVNKNTRDDKLPFDGVPEVSAFFSACCQLQNGLDKLKKQRTIADTTNSVVGSRSLRQKKTEIKNRLDRIYEDQMEKNFKK